MESSSSLVYLIASLGSLLCCGFSEADFDLWAFV